jgi:predicted regulator of Ras-like GTPase activity (Roadblock/LC7/MglB family)
LSTDVFVTALRNSLKEIRNICPDVKCSFLFTRDGALVAGDEQADDTAMEKAVRLFQNVAEKAAMIGGLDTFLIDGDNGRVYISCANDMYLAMVTSKNADMPYLRSVTRVIIPTILKLLESVVPTPLKFVPSLQLIVDTLSGFRSRFAADTVEIDHETLNQWSELFDGKDVSEVEIEAFSGRQARCRVRAIEDPALEGKGLIRIPQKAFQALEVKKGELVRVKPIAP